MLALVAWWLALSAMGWLCWPLVALLLPHTPGRGYAYARTIGLLLLSYVAWLGGILGLSNILALWGSGILLTCICLFVGLGRRRELGRWFAQEWRHVLTVELLFALICLLYAAHKAYDPAIDHTEEPMDFAFLNGILRSGHMPPNDPWLAGHSISYYYLGYLTVAILTRLTGLPSGMGYNLGLTHTLALTVVGAYGVLYDILSGNWPALRSRRGVRALAIWGALAIGLAGNLEGVLEAWRAGGWGLQGFLRWLEVPGLADAPTSGGWLPAGRWWWWRASRIIQDVNWLGRGSTVITEFPAFSFILGDLHPHVMALPYMLLGVDLAVELYQLGHRGASLKQGGWLRYGALGLLLGALGFLNSWDLPTLLATSTLAFFLGRYRGDHPWTRCLRDSIALGGCLLAGSLLFYWPFYRTLHTQAQGLGLAYYAKTPLKHYLLCFGPWILPLLGGAVDGWVRLCRRGGLRGRRLAWGIWGATFLLPWLVTFLLGGVGRFILGIAVTLSRGPWLLLLQSALLTGWLLEMCFLVRQMPGGSHDSPEKHQHNALFTPTLLLARLFLLGGVGLTYLVEFMYLRDVFDTRMNTVFKLYYQAWVLLGLGATLTAYELWQRGGRRRIVVCLSLLILGACYYYPLAAAYTRAEGYHGTPTLDGTAFLRDLSLAEYGAYRWLQQHATPEDVLAEGVGEEYVATTNRLSAWTGVPTILGWPGHEVQWRGEEREVRARMAAVERLYTTQDAQEALAILHRYGVTYFYVGPYEMQKYGLDDARLSWYESFLERVYATGRVWLYRVPPQ